MESPEGWDLLTSSLAVCDLQKPAAVWAFLAVQGLVRNQPSDRIAFFKIVHKVRTQSPSTSSSRARRIAERLRLKGMTLPVADTPDPKGEIALERRQLMDLWTKSFVQTGERPQPGYLAGETPETVQKMFTLCNVCFQVYDLSEPHTCLEPPEAAPNGPPTTENVCSGCHAANRIDARFCRGCGNPLPVDQSSSVRDYIGLGVILEQGKSYYDSQPSSPNRKADGCFFDVLNAIRELRATHGLSKKTHKR